MRRCNPAALFLFAFFGAFFLCGMGENPSGRSQGVSSGGLVTRVIDGDTLDIDGGPRGTGDRIRLIGVDTPEIHHKNKTAQYFGYEAQNFTRRQMQGRRVRLETDPANVPVRHRDKYGRLLAYVYREPDGFFLNAEVIRQGYGHAYTRFPYARADEFRQLERAARAGKTGLWAKGGTDAGKTKKRRKGTGTP